MDLEEIKQRLLDLSGRAELTEEEIKEFIKLQEELSDTTEKLG